MSASSTERHAVVLLSGGLDSATVLAIAQADAFTCHALTFDYGQRHRCELEAARDIAARLGTLRHIILPLDLRAFGGSALTDSIVTASRSTRRQNWPSSQVSNNRQ